MIIVHFSIHLQNPKFQADETRPFPDPCPAMPAHPGPEPVRPCGDASPGDVLPGQERRGHRDDALRHAVPRVCELS